VFVEDDGACSAGADVDAKIWNTASLISRTRARLARDAVSDTCLVRERLTLTNGTKTVYEWLP
jgi:hypothetical protein